MGLILDLDISKCVGCGACTVACADQNDLDLNQVRFRTVQSFEEKTTNGFKFTSISIACMHCEDAPCIAGCPVGCIQKDPETGFTVVDNTNCIGCHSCAMACPYGATSFDSFGKMVKCDGCIDRVLAGLQPACVQVCPFDALKLFAKQDYLHQKITKSLHIIAKLV